MGITAKLIGTKVFIDTSPFIYFIEKHPIYLKLLKPVFTLINSGDIEAMTSNLDPATPVCLQHRQERQIKYF